MNSFIPHSDHNVNEGTDTITQPLAPTARAQGPVRVVGVSTATSRRCPAWA